MNGDHRQTNSLFDFFICLESGYKIKESEVVL